MEIRRGQSTWEYALVLVLASLAFVTMSTYFKRGVQGRLKAMTDTQVSSVQYVSGETKSDTTTASKSSAEITNETNAKTTTSKEDTTRHSTEYSTGVGWNDLLPK